MSLMKKVNGMGTSLSRAIAIGVTVIAVSGFMAPEAHAQNNKTPKTMEEAKDMAKEVGTGLLWNILMGGVQDGVEVIEHKRNERVTTQKTESTASEAYKREQIMRQYGQNCKSTMSVKTGSGSSGDPTHSVGSSQSCDNNTAYDLNNQAARDAYYRDKRIRDAVAQQEIYDIQHEGNAARLEQTRLEKARIAEEAKAKLLRQQESRFTAQGSNTTTVPTLDARTQQQLDFCVQLQSKFNSGQTPQLSELPLNCENMLKKHGKYKPRQP